MERCALWPSRLSGKERRWVKYVGFERGDVYVRDSRQNGITVGHTEKLGSPRRVCLSLVRIWKDLAACFLLP